MNQRRFPFCAFLPQPLEATPAQVAQCTSEADAIAVSLAACRSVRYHDGRLKTQGVFAELVSKSKAYVSQIKHGERKVPDWMVTPFCTFTGTSLLRQYRDFHEAQAIASGQNSENFRRRQIVATLQIAIQPPPDDRRAGQDRRAA